MFSLSLRPCWATGEPLVVNGNHEEGSLAIRIEGGGKRWWRATLSTTVACVAAARDSFDLADNAWKAPRLLFLTVALAPFPSIFNPALAWLCEAYIPFTLFAPPRSFCI